MYYGKVEGYSYLDNLFNFEKKFLIVVVIFLFYLDSMLNFEVKCIGDNYKVVYLIN